MAEYPRCRMPGCTRSRARWSGYCADHIEKILHPECPNCGSMAHTLCNREPLSELEKRYMDGDR
jgi:hypothetical protein